MVLKDQVHENTFKIKEIQKYYPDLWNLLLKTERRHKYTE